MRPLNSLPLSMVLVAIAACAASPSKRQSSPQAHAPQGVTSSSSKEPSAPTIERPKLTTGVKTSQNCPAFSNPQALFALHDSHLAEASGLALSRRHPGLFWLHNDSGDQARVYGVQDGQLRYQLRLNDVHAIDFEDIAITAQASGTDALYVADTGDNFRTRAEVSIYRIAEPELTDINASNEIVINDVDRVFVRYHDGPQDVEAMFVEPATHDIYLIHKGRVGVNYLYQIPDPQMQGEHVQARKVATLKLGLVTAADISRDGTSILVRTYLDVFFWTRTKDQSMAQALSRPPCALPHADEPQGESIAFAPDGTQYFTLSEGVGQPFYRFEQQPNTAREKR